MSAVLESRLLIRKDREPQPPGEVPFSETAPVLPGITLRSQPFSRGPLAAIYRGWDHAHRCDVVVKVQRTTDDPVARNRFQREAAVMLRLRHPSIVTLYSYQEGNPAALIMEYVPGRTLAALIAAEGFLSPARTAQIIEEIAAALDCVHAVGIVHRDIKPSNILLPRHGPAKLTDFGVAHTDDDAPLTVMGDVLGTVEYASPEQVHGNGIPDTRSDVYSLAAVTYFVLTGTPPFQAADNSTQAQLSVMHRQVFSEPPPLRLHRTGLTPAIEEAVLRGLAKAPGDRYDSAGQLAAALRAAVVAASGEPQQSAMAAASRRSGARAGALAGALLLMAGFAFWKIGGLTPPAAPLSARPTKQRDAGLTPRPKAFQSEALETPVFKSSLWKHPHFAAVAAARQPQTSIPHPVGVTTKFHPLSQPPFHRVLSYSSVLIKFSPHQHVPTIAALNASAGHQGPRTRAGDTAALPEPPHSRASAGVGWYAVSGWISLTDPTQKTPLIRASALWIKVDGQPLRPLALGQWAALPAGKHLITFQPSPGLGAGPKTWAIDLSPQAHLSQQVPLPSAPLPDIPTHLRNP